MNDWKLVRFAPRKKLRGWKKKWIAKAAREINKRLAAAMDEALLAPTTGVSYKDAMEAHCLRENGLIRKDDKVYALSDTEFKKPVGLFTGSDHAVDAEKKLICSVRVKFFEPMQYVTVEAEIKP